jgi:hypothetical protein
MDFLAPSLGGIVVWLVISSPLAYWVYKDAKGRNLHDPGGWGWLTFFTVIVFLPIYLLWGRNWSTDYPGCNCAQCRKGKVSVSVGS